MRSIKHLLPFFLLLALSLTACGIGGPTTNPLEPINAPITTNIAPTPTSTAVAIPSESESLVSQAIADLALRLQVTEEEIAVVSVEAVDWPNTSLGCPQPRMMYAQVVTPGFQILLQAERVLYIFHSDEVDHVVLCQTRPPDDIYPTP